MLSVISSYTSFPVTVGVIAAQEAGNREAQVAACQALESAFVPANATPAEKQVYADCIGTLYPSQPLLSEGTVQVLQYGAATLLAVFAFVFARRMFLRYRLWRIYGAEALAERTSIVDDALCAFEDAAVAAFKVFTGLLVAALLMGLSLFTFTGNVG